MEKVLRGVADDDGPVAEVPISTSWAGPPLRSSVALMGSIFCQVDRCRCRATYDLDASDCLTARLRQQEKLSQGWVAGRCD